MEDTTKSPIEVGYDSFIDFGRLAEQDIAFKKYYNQDAKTIDFKDPAAVQQLTLSLLQRDFNLDLDLPEDRLCPPVPIRYEYVRWIQGLIDTTGPKHDDQYDPGRLIYGLDIGVGASCIYPLLACKSRSCYSMFGTEIDEKNYIYARDNVTLNCFHYRIAVRWTDEKDFLFPLEAFGIDHLDFTMCNPPFYASEDEMKESALKKELPPNSVCTGAPVEMICEGGEAAFVLRMVEQSMTSGNKIQWYTSMVGKYDTVAVVVDKLKAIGIKNWAVNVLHVSEKTRRWVVGWSWDNARPHPNIARTTSLPKSVLPIPSLRTIHLERDSVEDGIELLEKALESLDGVIFEWTAAMRTGVGSATEKSWGRAYRRQNKVSLASNNERPVDKPVILGFGIFIEDSLVQVRWAKGTDFKVFESFVGHLRGAVQSTLRGRSRVGSSTRWKPYLPEEHV